MKKITCFILCMVLALTLCACGNNSSTEKNSPEDLAATCVEAFLEKDFETMLETFPSFVVCNYALALCKNPNADIEAVALELHKEWEYDRMEVEILSTSLIEEYEIIDYYTQYIELELSRYLSVSEFCQITDYAVVRVDYLEDGYATYNDEVKCVKIDGKWFVLSHGFI